MQVTWGDTEVLSRCSGWLVHRNKSPRDAGILWFRTSPVCLLCPTGPRQPTPDGGPHASWASLCSPCHNPSFDLKRHCKHVNKASKQMRSESCLWCSIGLFDSLVSKLKPRFQWLLTCNDILYLSSPHLWCLTLLMIAKIILKNTTFLFPAGVLVANPKLFFKKKDSSCFLFCPGFSLAILSPFLSSPTILVRVNGI